MSKHCRLVGKEIEIAGIKYKVIYKKPCNYSRGTINFQNRTITLENGMAPSEEVVTLMHEILHGTLDSLVPVKILDKYVTEEELLIGPMARVLVGALRSAGLLRE